MGVAAEPGVKKRETDVAAEQVTASDAAGASCKRGNEDPG
jgi:hypothetical protein